MNTHDEQQGNDSTLEGCGVGVESDEGEPSPIQAPGMVEGRHGAAFGGTYMAPVTQQWKQGDFPGFRRISYLSTHHSQNHEPIPQ